MSDFETKYRELIHDDRAAVADVLGAMRKRPGDYYIVDVVSGLKHLMDSDGTLVHSFRAPTVWTRDDFSLSDWLYHPLGCPEHSYQFKPEFVDWYYARFAPTDDEIATWLGVALFQKWTPDIQERRHSSLFELGQFRSRHFLTYEQYVRARDHLKFFKLAEENGGHFEDIAWIYLTDKGGKWAMSGFPKPVDFDSHRTPVEVTVRVEMSMTATFMPAVWESNLPDEKKHEIENAIENIEANPTLSNLANLFTMVNGARELVPPFLTAMKATLPQLLDRMK